MNNLDRAAQPLRDDAVSRGRGMDAVSGPVLRRGGGDIEDNQTWVAEIRIIVNVLACNRRRNPADGLPVFLRLHMLWRAPETETRRLLCVLFLRRPLLPALLKHLFLYLLVAFRLTC